MIGSLSIVLLCAAARAPGPGQGITIEAGTGRVVSLSGAAGSVFAADPKVVEVRPASPTSLFLFGVGPGRTTVAALSATGQPIAQFEVTVGPNTYAAGAANRDMAAALPGNQLAAGMRGNGLVLNGSVGTASEAERAAAAARSNLGERQILENRTRVRSSVQVNLRVRVVEMSRNLTRELGVNWQALANVGGRYGNLRLRFRARAGHGRQFGPRQRLQVPDPGQGRGHQQRHRRPGAGPARACPGRAEHHGDERRGGQLHCGRRVPDPGRGL
jgi:Flp pilus assembly secretin CpaC